MDTEFLNYTAQNVLTIIRSGGPITWSWGSKTFRTELYAGKAALRFSVSGFVHKGDVVVALNQAADLYEVYCLDRDGAIVSLQIEVYFDELVAVIDRLVEKNCPTDEYAHKTGEWLEENRM
jgi:hypothetical protein